MAFRKTIFFLLSHTNSFKMSYAVQLVNFILFVYIFSGTQIHARKIQSLAAPEIWLSSLTEVDALEAYPVEEGFRKESQFHNDFVFKNDTDYVALDGTSDVVFSCRARYPVIWTFPHMEQIDKTYFYAYATSASRTSELHQNQPEPFNKYFETLLTINFVYSNFFSVNLTCESTEGGMPRKSSSIHVYLAGNQAIENPGETVQVYVPPSKEKDTSGVDTVILPCRPATPNITILLEKRTEHKIFNANGSPKKWIRFKVPTNYVNFDPKKGFILAKGKRSYIYGLYRCIALEEGQDEDSSGQGEDEQDDSNRDTTGSQLVFINVTSKEIEGISEFRTIMDLRENASVSYNQQSFGKYPLGGSKNTFNGGDLTCCSGLAGILPEIYTETCAGSLQCKILKHLMARKIHDQQEQNFYSRVHSLNNGRDDCAQSFFYGGTVIYCKAATLQFVHSFNDMFHEDLFPMTNRLKKARGGILPMTQFDTEEAVLNANLSQKIFLTIGYPATSEELIGNHHYWSGQQLFPLTKRKYEDDDTMNYDYETVPNDVLYQNRKHSFRIAEYSRDVYYEGEPLVVFCLGWKYLYAEGAHLSISWKNGTISVLEGPEKHQEIHFMKVHFSDCNPTSVGEFSTVYKFGETVEATKDMVSVHCHMPQVSGSGWDTLSRNLTVLEASLPKWVEGEGNITEEVVYFYLQEEQEKRLECRLESGAPEPKINVTKDGKQILNNLNLSSLFNVTVISNDTAADNNAGNGTTSVLDDGGAMIKIVISFDEVSHETGGVYQCTAENLRGKVTRTFKVIVTERKSVVLPIFLSIMVLFSVLLLVAGGRHHWLKRRNSGSSQRGNECR